MEGKDTKTRMVSQKVFQCILRTYWRRLGVQKRVFEVKIWYPCTNFILQKAEALISVGKSISL